MTYEEFHRQVGKAGLSIREFAELMKMHRNSVTNYAKHGEVPAHLAIIAVLFGAMAESKLDFRAVLRTIEFESKLPRGGSAKGRFAGDKQGDLLISGVPASSI